MILPGLVYKFASLPPISAHFLPQSRAVAGPSAAEVGEGWQPQY